MAKELARKKKSEVAIHTQPLWDEPRKHKLTLQEKFSNMTWLDEEILNLVGEEEVEDEIKQANLFKE